MQFVTVFYPIYKIRKFAIPNLKEENNNSQIIYSYNTNGNIITKQEYSLQGQTPTLLHTTTYTYNNIYKDENIINNILKKGVLYG